jgi:hypothetical protein
VTTEDPARGFQPDTGRLEVSNSPPLPADCHSVIMRRSLCLHVGPEGFLTHEPRQNYFPGNNPPSSTYACPFRVL